MALLVSLLLFSTLGGSFLIHYLKNFLLNERVKLHPDWDGVLERLCLTYIILEFANLWFIIPVIILLRIILRLAIQGSLTTLARANEPGTVLQKVLIKSELAIDFTLSPAWAILLGVIFK